MHNHRAKGRAGEDTAVDYLTKKGYHILERNFRFERGEIDIIAVDKEDLVFVEVKARRSKAFGDPEDALTAAKCNQIRKVAEGYLSECNIDDQQCRFDVIAIEYEEDVPVIRHLVDAF